MSDIILYPRGSEWRKWDLHIHTKGTNKNDQFKSKTFEEFCVILFKKALEKEIAVIGITDYFSIENYKKVKNFVDNINSCDNFTDKEKKQIKRIFILPNVELRMMPVTDSGKLVNIHCLFNPDYESSLENNFFGAIEYSTGQGKKCRMNRQGLIDLGKSLDPNLNDDKAYEKGVDTFIVTHSDLQKLLDENTGFRKNVIIAVSNSNKDGASAFQKHYDLFEDIMPGSLDAVRKSIYSISDCVFSSNIKDVNYFSGLKKDSEEIVKKKCGSIKPCIHGSDAHTEDNLFSPDQNKFCWVKADPNFEGFKQIIYEPRPGERIWIGPVEPDQKDEFKVIRKIKFSHTKSFPKEIEFNKNLCSIIGSRSSGKSALLAYIADSIDPIQTKDKKKEGPGDGFPWEKVNFDYWIEWENGKTSKDTQGEIIYIPQNYLFEISDKPGEIKKRIKPVLINKLPKFGAQYIQTERDIKDHNQQILERVDAWFSSRALIDFFKNGLKKLGDKKAVKGEKKRIEFKINGIKKKHKLNKNELEKYQKISAKISGYKTKIKQIETSLLRIGNISKKNNYFNSLKYSPIPTLDNLPEELQKKIRSDLQTSKISLFRKINKQVFEYKESIEEEQKNVKKEISEIKKKNKDLIKKYQKNVELEALVEKLNKHKEVLRKIDKTIAEKNSAQGKLKQYEQSIKSEIDKRKSKIKKLEIDINSTDQSILEDIKFGVECDFNKSDVGRVKNGVNVKAATNLVKKYELDIGYAREDSSQILEDIYSKKQGINKGYEKKEVAQGILTLTEEILFTAEMEGDKIGGFAESTMTPGKRALFALRLLLVESEDTWPLLIDQPEDDLDSRSICEDIVPFLKDKKKKRQIIMVSHNANLVIGSDSEQIIVANKHGSDRKNKDGKLFNYLTGSIEHTKEKDKSCKDELKAQGIQEHACVILDGGKAAFEHRGNKYNLAKSRIKL